MDCKQCWKRCTDNRSALELAIMSQSFNDHCPAYSPRVLISRDDVRFATRDCSKIHWFITISSCMSLTTRAIYVLVVAPSVLVLWYRRENAIIYTRRGSANMYIVRILQATNKLLFFALVLWYQKIICIFVIV